jgi:apolipoprotein N-acyltransferase
VGAIERTSLLTLAAPALAGGLLVALSLPPWGWWPLAWLGVGLLVWRLDGQSWRRRALLGTAFGLGEYVVGLWWMGEFNRIGGFLSMIGESAFLAVGLALVPAHRRHWAAPIGVPAALLLVEAFRDRFPFGGVPMAGLAFGQVDGPLAPAARVGGALLVLGLAAAAGAALAQAAARRPALAAALGALTALLAAAGLVAPDGGPAQHAVHIAVVQGGGRRGFRAIASNAQDVFDRQLRASEKIRPPVDLVLWPEDVIDVDVPVAQTNQAAAVGALAVSQNASVIAGVVEDAGPEHFRNAAVLWSPEGRILARYDKAHRVPFGEYVPLRPLIEKLVDLSVIPRDAVPGRGPGLLRPPTTPPVGLTISYEVYFADRARAAVHAGAQVLLVPTNAASFSTTQVPTTEVAAAKLRALEAGRDLAQAAPTGYGALIDHRGRLHARTVLGRNQVLQGVLRARTGTTVYGRTGDGPVVLLALLALAVGWLPTRLAKRPSS